MGYFIFLRPFFPHMTHISRQCCSWILCAQLNAFLMWLLLLNSAQLTSSVPVLIINSLSEAYMVFFYAWRFGYLPPYNECRETCNCSSLVMFLVNVRNGPNLYVPHGLLGIPSSIIKQTYLSYWMKYNNSAWFLFWCEVGNCIVVEGQSWAAMKIVEERRWLSRPSQQGPSGGKTEILNKKLIFCAQKNLNYWNKRNFNSCLCVCVFLTFEVHNLSNTLLS